ncbi:MAG: hypothetical protein A7316_09645 [Candidatus Altiarchaeales archaeon WOR_SM1_86-2]|nr:MAG: hypothetical protein A7316_09645 [Candidatus Altiarchaeales archaeon WOR_SM1_86-2]ODS40140.1 MAG: hypothetical protein A7315_09500 [Candidatus Altiarchaeales archaeon WOR_SM1_79]
MDVGDLSLEPEVMEKLKKRGFRTVESLATASIQELVSGKYGITIYSNKRSSFILKCPQKFVE